MISAPAFEKEKFFRKIRLFSHHLPFLPKMQKGLFIIFAYEVK
jgi:hypothetical protein